MNALQDYCSLWKLENPALLQETPRATLYRVKYANVPAVLKISRPLGLEHERQATAFLSLCPTEISVKILKSQDNAVLMEDLPGPALSEEVRQGRDDRATEIIASTALRVSNIPVPQTHSFIPLRTWFRALFEKSGHAGENPALYETAAPLAHELLSADAPQVLLHGDLHHDNMIRDETGRYKMIDPKGLIGHPAYEVANAFRNPHGAGLVTKERILRQAGIFSATLGRSQREILGFGFIHAAISPLWSLEDNEDFGDSLKVARLFHEIWEERA
ncbi:MAG: phosphotransferase [Rhodospirillales bacterium]|nr:phosphotransferase [Alphaproteobacteria bacterium]MCB9977540.1 phosphotransferase [Rhodospirillales bacterium]